MLGKRELVVQSVRLLESNQTFPHHNSVVGLEIQVLHSGGLKVYLAQQIKRDEFKNDLPFH